MTVSLFDKNGTLRPVDDVVDDYLDECVNTIFTLVLHDNKRLCKENKRLRKALARLNNTRGFR